MPTNPDPRVPESAPPDRWLPFLQTLAVDTLAYRETRRLPFDAALAAIVVLYIAYRWPESRTVIGEVAASRVVGSG